MKPTDRPLDVGRVRRLVADQFPALAGRSVRPLGVGWDNEVYLVGGADVFRFPKRAERVVWQEREVDVVSRVARVFGPLGGVLASAAARTAAPYSSSRGSIA